MPNSPSIRLRLRWKILLFTSVPLLLLILPGLWLIHDSVARQVERNMRDDLIRSSAVFENMLAARFEQLGIAGQVIVQDPRFFSVLTLPGSTKEPEYKATVSGVAGSFNAITNADLFEVLDAEERLLASVGSDFTNRTGRTPFVRTALEGRPASGILVDPQAHYQVHVTPIVAGGRVVGALLIGDRIDRDLATRLRELTRSEVTFFSRRLSTGSTLEMSDDRTAILASLDRARRPVGRDATLLQVQGPQHSWLTLARQIAQSNPLDGQIYVMQRALDVEMAFLRDMRAHLFELGAIAVLVALLAGFLIAERITSPLQRLVRGAEEMEHNNYDYPLHVRSSDEIGYLAARFDEMRQHQRAVVTSLEEVARLKSEFMSVASHELRTPISVIRGYQELMQQEQMGTLTPTQRDALEAIGKSVNTLSRIAEDATRVAQIENGRMILSLAEHDLAALVERALENARSAAPGRRVELIDAVDPTVGAARVDASRLVQALTHLICNGIRFTPDGGRVQVSATRGDGEVVIEVRDSGVGIPENKLRDLFDRTVLTCDALHHHSSSTLAFNSSGLGVGLPITRGIVQAHGGRLEVNSTPGQGSTFIIRLPAEPVAGMEAVA